MKKSIIMKNNIAGLTSFLDKNNAHWVALEDDLIKIYYWYEFELLKLIFKMGRYNETIKN